jgi:hypothetical protein
MRSTAALSLTKSTVPGGRDLLIARAWARLRWWHVLLVLVLVEAVAFHTTARDSVAPFYPMNLDQVQYLGEAYSAYDLIKAHGITGAWEVFQAPRAQGMLLQDQAALAFLFTGASRLVAIDINLAYFLLYLWVSTETARRLGGLAAALTAAGLILAAATTTQITGGLFDFRLDFAAMCLWGTLLALLVLARPTGQPKRSLLVPVALASAALILTRIITVAYIVGLVAGLILVAILIRFGSRRLALRLGPRRLAMVLVTTVLVAGAYVAHNWDILSTYYLFGHVTGTEKHTRALEVGVTDLLSSIEFYFQSLLTVHAGTDLVTLAAGLVLAIFLVMLICGGFHGAVHKARLHVSAVAWMVSVLALAFAIPYVALTLDEAKSGVVGDVLLPPTILGVVAVFAFASRLPYTRARWAEVALLVLSLAAFGYGVRTQIGALQQNAYRANREDLAAASRMMLEVGDYVRENSSGQTIWGIDGHLDFTAPGVAWLYYYEQRGIWLPMAAELGVGAIQTTLSQDEVLREAAASDVLLLTKGGSWTYPYDQSIEQAKVALFNLAAERFTLFRSYRMFGRDVYVFIRNSSRDQHSGP